ncbi:MAG TPA: hypothetical protein PLD20_22870 [Blastocatellia bacterium]|nr:hypothetical protein [Blastocatellia bacterium]HMZ20795.1 hypothetical protein [Blastocatellia bacterium]HNG30042.1 hypothetical protein [Blastocatellia bacterium]
MVALRFGYRGKFFELSVEDDFEKSLRLRQVAHSEVEINWFHQDSIIYATRVCGYTEAKNSGIPILSGES